MANDLTIERLFTRVISFAQTNDTTRSGAWHDLIVIAERWNDLELWVRIGKEMDRVSTDHDDISGKVADRYVELAPDDAFRQCMHGNLNRYRNWRDRREKLSC